MSKKYHVGIFGGTFDPIHMGHLLTAETVRDQYKLEKVVFIPAAVPPHKQDKLVTPAVHRYNMTLLATADNPYFTVSDIEMHRQGPSYSRDTLAELTRVYGQDTEFYFIVGADSIAELHTWNRVEELLAICHFIGASRPGNMADFASVQASFGTLGNKLHQVDTPELDISSTAIRQMVEQQQSIKYIVPEAVEQYIYKEKLYTSVSIPRNCML